MKPGTKHLLNHVVALLNQTLALWIFQPAIHNGDFTRPHSHQTMKVGSDSKVPGARPGGAGVEPASAGPQRGEYRGGGWVAVRA